MSIARARPSGWLPPLRLPRRQIPDPDGSQCCNCPKDIHFSLHPWRLRLAALLVLLAMSSCSGASAEDKADDPRILGQTLTQCLPGNGETFSVVYPTTQLVLQDRSGTALDSIADRIRNLSGDPGYDARPLLDRHKRNKWPRPAPLTSSPGAVFLVDSSDTYTKYLESGNEGDWKRIYHDHPEVKSVVHVGLPAHDRKRGLVLVCVQEMTQVAAGNGSIYILAWDGTTAEKLGRVVVWSP